MTVRSPPSAAGSPSPAAEQFFYERSVDKAYVSRPCLKYVRNGLFKFYRFFFDIIGRPAFIDYPSYPLPCQIRGGKHKAGGLGRVYGIKNLFFYPFFYDFRYNRPYSLRHFFLDFFVRRPCPRAVVQLPERLRVFRLVRARDPENTVKLFHGCFPGPDRPAHLFFVLVYEPEKFLFLFFDAFFAYFLPPYRPSSDSAFL